MKTTMIIKSLALVLAAGYPCVAFAEFLGARLPASINFENSLTAFSALIIGLTLAGDYARRNRVCVASVPTSSPAPVAKSAREHHRLAA